MQSFPVMHKSARKYILTLHTYNFVDMMMLLAGETSNDGIFTRVFVYYIVMLRSRYIHILIHTKNEPSTNILFFMRRIFGWRV